MLRRVNCSVIILLICLASIVTAQVPTYTLTDLGGFMSLAINTDGVMAGFIFVATPDAGNASAQHAATWEDGVVTDLGIVGSPGPFTIGSIAEAIGDKPVGYASSATINQIAVAGNGAGGLAPLPSAETFPASSATARSLKFGMSAGYALSPDNVTVIALKWGSDTKAPKLLPSLGGGFDAASAINTVGQVVGTSRLPTGELHAVKWPLTGGIQDLGGGPTGLFAQATCITLWSIIGGSTLNGGAVVPARWVGGVLELLPLLPGFTNGGVDGCSNPGTLVGYLQIPGSSPGDTINHAALWDAVGTPTDLHVAVNDPHWVLTFAHAISNAGEIAGVGLMDGVPHGWLLTPVAEVASQ